MGWDGCHAWDFEKGGLVGSDVWGGWMLHAWNFERVGSLGQMDVRAERLDI